MEPAFALSLVIFLPTLVALLLSFAPKGSDEWIKLVTFVATVVPFGLTIGLILMPFDTAQAGLQQVRCRMLSRS